MTEIIFDFETYSFCDLNAAGAWVYSEHETTGVFCMAWMTPEMKAPKLWQPGEAVPEEFFKEDAVYIAHNSLFEYALVCNVCIGQHGFPERMRLADNWHCTRAMAKCVGLPGSLDDVARVLKVKHQKLSSGKALINKYSKPYTDRKTKEKKLRPLTGADKKAMFEYCRVDTWAEFEIYTILRNMKNVKLERPVFLQDFKLNVEGLPVDVKGAQTVIKKLDELTVKAEEEAESLGVNVRSPKQLLEFFAKNGVHVDNTRKDTIDTILGMNPKKEVAEACELRRFLGKSSVKKFKSLLSMTAKDSRIRYTLFYFGANTGRWSGRGFQPHNLIKTGTDEKEINNLIKAVPAMTDRAEFLGAAQKILPGLIQAPTGETFIMGDFSAIEARGLAYLAGETWRLDVFKTHGKIYEASAAKILNRPISSIEPGSKERKVGKVAELALGYQGAVGALYQFGADKLGLSEDDMVRVIKDWRGANRKIVSFWYELESAFSLYYSRRKEHHKVYVGKHIQVRAKNRYIAVRLPSGRELFYHDIEASGDGVSFFNHSQNRRVQLYGGLLAENVVQAMCRDILADCMLRLQERGLDTAFHVHDEIICQTARKDVKEKQKIFDSVTNTAPAWLPGFPLSTESEISRRYHK